MTCQKVEDWCHPVLELPGQFVYETQVQIMVFRDSLENYATHFSVSGKIVVDLKIKLPFFD